MSQLLFLYLLLWFLTNAGVNLKESVVSKPDDKIICMVPLSAIYPGGINAWKNFLSKNSNYPQSAVNHHVEGIVRVQVIILESGIITEVQALNNPGYGLAEEAERVIKSSPPWHPSMKNGKPTVSRMVQSITFKLN